MFIVLVGTFPGVHIRSVSCRGSQTSSLTYRLMKFNNFSAFPIISFCIEKKIAEIEVAAGSGDEFCNVASSAACWQIYVA